MCVLYVCVCCVQLDVVTQWEEGRMWCHRHMWYPVVGSTAVFQCLSFTARSHQGFIHHFTRWAHSSGESTNQVIDWNPNTAVTKVHTLPQTSICSLSMIQWWYHMDKEKWLLITTMLLAVCVCLCWELICIFVFDLWHRLWLFSWLLMIFYLFTYWFDCNNISLKGVFSSAPNEIWSMWCMMCVMLYRQREVKLSWKRNTIMGQENKGGSENRSV